MYYSTPLGVAQGVSAAHVVGTITTTIINAPGVGNTIRLVGYHVKINRNAGAAIVDELLVAGGTIISSVSLSLAGTSAMEIYIPAPGIQLGDNVALVLQSTSTVAAGSSTGTAYFFIDNIS